MAANDVLITGIGLVSSLGVGADAHWRLLSRGGAAPVLEGERFAPYQYHPLPEIDWSTQIAKRGDLRQMETWQRLGTYAAGLALVDAAMKGDEDLCATMDMIVAAGGGERDEAVDQSILDESLRRDDREVLLNEKLTTELRPTLFLAQLSNLLAGNISIVHKVTGSSRTFMGEESAGVSAIETGAARIRAGQSSHILVGGAFQCGHPDMLLGYELGGYLHDGPFRSVWQRQGMNGGGVVPGSGGAFLVMESRAHAEGRGRQAYARIDGVASSHGDRHADAFVDTIATLLSKLDPLAGPGLVVSGASGAHEATAAERTALRAAGHDTVRGMTTMTGHMKEAQFPFAIALGALALHHGASPAAFDEDETAATSASPASALATAIGYHHFEGVASLSRASGE